MNDMNILLNSYTAQFEMGSMISIKNYRKRVNDFDRSTKLKWRPPPPTRPTTTTTRRHYTTRMERRRCYIEVYFLWNKCLSVSLSLQCISAFTFRNARDVVRYSLD